MPLVTVVFHVADALAHDGLGDDARRLAVGVFCFLHRAQNLGVVVAVDDEGVPAVQALLAGAVEGEEALGGVALIGPAQAARRLRKSLSDRGARNRNPLPTG